MEQVYIPTINYKVLVRCYTYNHSKYIEDALNGFAMQKTDFPFVCLVMDDCSTDGEQDIIKAWMERECDMENAENIEIEKSFVSLVPHKSNLNCQFAFYFLKENLYKKGGKAQMVAPWREHCEYEALCEGDDYWICPEKLQMQVDFMASNPEYTMCFHNAIVIWDNIDKDACSFATITDREYSGCEMYNSWIVPFASILMQCGVYSSGIYERVVASSKIVFGDIAIVLSCAHEGKVFGFSNSMSVYRRQHNGLTQILERDIDLRCRLAEQHKAIAEVFGAHYRKISKDKYIRNCCLIFIKSLRSTGPTRYDYLKRSLLTSVSGTISTLLSIAVSHL